MEYLGFPSVEESYRLRKSYVIRAIYFGREESSSLFSCPHKFFTQAQRVGRPSFRQGPSLTGKNSNYVFLSCRKSRSGLESYLKRMMVDSTVGRLTKSMYEIC